MSAPKIFSKIVDEENINFNFQDNNGQTVLQYALSMGDNDVVMKLLDKKVDLNIYDKYGNGPLWTACMNNEIELKVIEKMLKLGANPDHINNVGKSPRMLISEFNIPELNLIFKNMPGKTSQ